MYPREHLRETLRRQAQTCVQISEVISVYIYICFAKSQIVGTRARGYVCDWL